MKPEQIVPTLLGVHVDLARFSGFEGDLHRGAALPSAHDLCLYEFP